MLGHFDFKLNLWEQKHNRILSYDVASESKITQCNKIDMPLLAYIITENVFDIHSNVAYIMTNFFFFYGRNEISKNSLCHIINII